MIPMSLHSAVADNSRPIVLASRSPRRRDLLQQMNIDFVVDPADIDETPHPGESPVDYVVRLSREKAATVAQRHRTGDGNNHDGNNHDGNGRDVVVLAADTTVDVDGEIFGQPVDIDDAVRMLRRLSGRTHRVHTAVTAMAVDGATATECVTSLVTFHPLLPNTIEWYVGTGEPMGKAGAYAVQGLGSTLVAAVRGSLTNVVGLPVAQTARLLGAVRR